MSKLYYTDPLAAAWMAREFGVMFLIDSEYGVKCIERFYNVICDEPMNKKHHIRSDSLHIFAPRFGDAVIVIDKNCHTVRDLNERNFPGLRTYSMNDKTTYGEESPLDYKIIQRDGKPFFWPEKEGK